MGAFAVDVLKEGISGQCIGIKNDKLVTSPLKDTVGHRKERTNLYDLVNKIR